jgi:hypothetical protein
MMMGAGGFEEEREKDVRAQKEEESVEESVVVWVRLDRPERRGPHSLLTNERQGVHQRGSSRDQPIDDGRE